MNSCGSSARARSCRPIFEAPMPDDPEYVIWSFEHNAWWRPGRMGYTTQLSQAGQYSRAESERIVARANIVKFNEQLMLLSTARAYALKGWHPITPGTYDDGRGGLHLVLEEMLAAHGYQDTPENRQTMIEVAREMMGGAAVDVID